VGWGQEAQVGFCLDWGDVELSYGDTKVLLAGVSAAGLVAHL
jgi:hypothetical protein